MNGRARGFTLIELLIALTLITLTLTLAFSALRLGTRSLERTDQLAGALEELRIARSVMQRHLAQARPLHEKGTESSLSFRGEARQVEFVAPAPQQGERLAGLYRYRLRFERSEAGEQLLLDYQPYHPGSEQHWPPGHETALLLDRLETGEFSFYAYKPEQAEWQNRWSDTTSLPRLVRVTLARPALAHEPLEMVVRLAAAQAR